MTNRLKQYYLEALFCKHQYRDCVSQNKCHMTIVSWALTMFSIESAMACAKLRQNVSAWNNYRKLLAVFSHTFFFVLSRFHRLSSDAFFFLCTVCVFRCCVDVSSMIFFSSILLCENRSKKSNAQLEVARLCTNAGMFLFHRFDRCCCSC